MRCAIRNVTVLTMDPENTVYAEADLLIEGTRLVAVGPDASSRWANDPDVEVIDGRGQVALPGFVQVHLHLCQAIFKNLADDMSLMDWLRTRIWPYEAAHSPQSLRASADLGLAELIRSGTTTILDMGTVHHTDAVAEAVRDAGSRAVIGNTMMDLREEVPDGLYQPTQEALAESERVRTRWHGAADGRLRFAYAPRFAISCTPALLRAVGERAQDGDVMVHTHSSETEFEVKTTLARYGKRNIPFLHACGLTGPRSVFAHGVWLDDEERALLRDTKTTIAHCPSANFKLGSGFADIPALDAAGCRVGIGSDGAPCNNTLDIWHEMRLAALLQKPRHGPQAMPAQRVLRMATIDGARALGLDHEIGSLEVGKRADVVLVRLDQPHNGVASQQWASCLVYATYPENVRDVMVDGRWLMREGTLLTLDMEALRAYASEALGALLRRV